MKKTTLPTKFNFTKKLMIGLLLLSGLFFSSYKSSACTASFSYTAGINGHCTFNGTIGGYGPYPHYSWNAGDGSGWQSGNINFAHTYITNNTFTVQFAVNDSLCFDTGSAIITVSNVSSPCILSASYTYTIVPYGFVNYTSTSTGTNAYTQYYWSPGDSAQRIRGTTTFTHQYAYPGTYAVWLILSDTGNAYCMDSVVQYVDVTSVDTAYCHIHASFTYAAGPNGQINFTSTSTGTGPHDAWFWNPGDTTGEGYTANTYTHTYLYNGTYNVILDIHADSTGGCYDSITVPVTVSNACNLQANFTDTVDYNLPAVGKVFFASTSAGTNVNTIYQWNFGDSTATVVGHDTITHWYAFNGSYNVTLIDSNITGCMSTVTHYSIYVDNRDSLQARFTYIPDSLTAGQYDFTSTSKGVDANTYYKWTPGDGNPSDSGLGMTSYQHIYSHNGPYSATLTIWYTILPHRMGGAPRYDLSSYTLVISVSTVSGIKSLTDSKIYNVYPNPNNGSFNVSVNGLANEKNAEIRISDMMGQVIYQSNTTVKDGNTLSNINLPNAANGVYLLQVITADNTYSSRISIQK